MGRPDDSSSIPTAPEAPEILDAEKPLRPSQLIGGRYDVRARLGAGRTGTVYRVHDCVLGEDVALKLLRPELVEDPRALERFRREVKLARKIAHPNVCRVFDMGERNGLAFVIMELVTGETLRAHIARGTGSISTRLHLFEQVARGLAAVHAERPSHHDLRSENILVRRDGTVVITDFGVAFEPAEEFEAGGIFVNAPPTKALDQIRDELLDASGDVFALGLVGYEILTGNRLVGELAPTVTTHAIVSVASVHLQTETVPAQVVIECEKLLSRTLAQKLNDRPRAADVADTIAALREAIQLAPALASAAKTSPSIVLSTRRQEDAKQPRILRTAIIFGIGVAASVVAFFNLFKTEPLPTRTSYAAASAAHADSPHKLTDQQLFDRYLPIWKRLFLKTNTMSTTEFTRRITSIKPSIVSWNLGVFLNIHYSIATGWTETKNADKIIICAYDTGNNCEQLHVPCNVLLDEADVELATLRKAGSAGILKIPSENDLKYLNREDAEASLHALTNECLVKYTGIILNQSSPVELVMKGSCTIEDRWNRCGKGSINLVTGAGEFSNLPCRDW